MKLLEMPSTTGAARRAFFEELYESAFLPFARFASKRGASLQETRDIFHDALIIYFEKCQDPEFRTRISPEAYVIGIGKHLWIRRFHDERLKLSLSNDELSIQVPEGFSPTVDEARLLAILERAGKRCLELLQKFYYENIGLKRLAGILGYRTEHSLAVQKYKCLQKMRDYIKSKAIMYEDFLN